MAGRYLHATTQTALVTNDDDDDNNNNNLTRHSSPSSPVPTTTPSSTTTAIPHTHSPSRRQTFITTSIGHDPPADAHRGLACTHGSVYSPKVRHSSSTSSTPR
ncbi:hypothetical protein CFE70_009238 [Pyrenophora teres f. teres 0-1]